MASLIFIFIFLGFLLLISSSYWLMSRLYWWAWRLIRRRGEQPMDDTKTWQQIKRCLGSKHT